MGYQPPTNSRKGKSRQYKQPFTQKSKVKKHLQRSTAQAIDNAQHIPTQQEIIEDTLKRLHTLGNQRFGSFPYSEHFNRWIASVETVLADFTSNPNIGIDDEFTDDCQQILNGIRNNLEQIHRKETTIDQELQSLSQQKNQLREIDNEYANRTRTLRESNHLVIQRINNEIEELKKEQEKIIKTKAGLFHRISKKERERREIAIIEELTKKQTELELATLDLKQAQKLLRDEFDKRRDPVLEEIKKLQKNLEGLESDGSLEERWFACEALTDAVNMFLLRKVAQSP